MISAHKFRQYMPRKITLRIFFCAINSVVTGTFVFVIRTNYRSQIKHFSPSKHFFFPPYCETSTCGRILMRFDAQVLKQWAIATRNDYNNHNQSSRSRAYMMLMGCRNEKKSKTPNAQMMLRQTSITATMLMLSEELS